MLRPLVPLLALALLAAQGVETIDGYGPWKFGMSHDDVAAFDRFGPYEPVSATGGLETPNGDFGGVRTNVSFVFDDDGLRFVQIWAYEGSDFDDAAAALHRVYEHVIRDFGEMVMGRDRLVAGLTVDQIIEHVPPPWRADMEPLTVEDIQRQGGSVSVARGEVIRIEPIWQPMGGRVFATFRRTPDIGVFYVFLYYSRS